MVFLFVSEGNSYRRRSSRSSRKVKYLNQPSNRAGACYLSKAFAERKAEVHSPDDALFFMEMEHGLHVWAL